MNPLQWTIWPYVSGALIGVLALLLFGYWSRGNEIDHLKTDRANCVAAHSVTRASLERLERAQADATAEAMRRAEAFEDARKRAEMAQAELRKLDANNADLAARLRASAAAPNTAICEPSKLTRELWK